MRFTKTQMQEELSVFLTLFAKQIVPLYGQCFPAPFIQDAIQTSPIWQTVNEMYDYGINGVAVAEEMDISDVIGRHIEVERFLQALNTIPMKIYLDTQENTPPRLALIAAQCASARRVLEGENRFNDLATEEFGPGNGDFGYLTLAEIALLANMDERSVRNAANPKLPNHLVTEQVGRRSLVRPEEARRWLAGRKGFFPTQTGKNSNKNQIQVVDFNDFKHQKLL